MKYILFNILLLFSCAAFAIDAYESVANDCHQQRKSLLESGTVTYSETVIDRLPNDIWPELFKYHLNPILIDANIEVISGEPKSVGHIVLISPAAKDARPFYAEIIAIRQLKNIVWKIYPENGCDYSLFQDFGLREVNGKSIFSINIYGQFSRELAELYKIQQRAGNHESVSSNNLGILLKNHLEK